MGLFGIMYKEWVMSKYFIINCNAHPITFLDEECDGLLVCLLGSGLEIEVEVVRNEKSLERE